MSRASAPSSNDWTLTWSDEFDGPDGSAPDSTRWNFDVGGHGWGNDELQTYTDRIDNAYIENGHLVIKAIKSPFTGADGIAREYTSARLNTLGHFSQTYGRFEACIKIPVGKGMWPAFWLLGENIPTVPWPHCGEIDIMEILGKKPAVLHGTVHGPGFSGSHGIGGVHELRDGRIYADDFHVFAVEWERDAIRYYIDDLCYLTLTPAEFPSGGAQSFQHPFFILLNVAVGGGWPGPPDDATVFPQSMRVDYVRVYRRAD
jgi:beta-glucanase (GH16 family)